MMRNFFLHFILSLLTLTCQAKEFPDLDGVLDFSKPEEISNQLFILTNPKSGSHLLLYSIMKITKRPLRGRVPYWHFENDPPFYTPENLMGYPIDFSKPTMYWGHEYYLLSKLNHRGNKLLFTLKNYKENITSMLIAAHHLELDQPGQKERLSELFLKAITKEEMAFKEYIRRLKLFDDWDPACCCLVSFEDLVAYPENFVPRVMAFIGDDADYLEFIDHYDSFKKELMQKYDTKKNRTGSGEDLHYFANFIPKEVFQAADKYVEEHYPDLWRKYLKKFKD